MVKSVSPRRYRRTSSDSTVTRMACPSGSSVAAMTATQPSTVSPFMPRLYEDPGEGLHRCGNNWFQCRPPSRVWNSELLPAAPRPSIQASEPLTALMVHVPRKWVLDTVHERPA